MDIYTYLKRDHKKVSQLFEKVILSKTSQKRESYFLEIKKELELHADSEQRTFYQALKISAAGEEGALHGEKEHKEIKKALSKLSKISPKERVKWLVQLGELKHMVEHHVEEEESKIFKDAKVLLSKEEAEELAVKMEEVKNKMAKSPSFQKKGEKLKKKKN